LENLFTGLISSKTRIKLLVRFFFNPKTRSYLRELAKEFDVSTNSVRKELNQLTKTNLLKCEKNGRQIQYMANQEHPLFPELKSMVAKVMGIDHVIEGKDSGIIDLVLVGNIDPYHLDDLSRKSERYIKRKIRSLVLNRDEYKKFEAKIKSSPHILIWEANKK